MHYVYFRRSLSRPAKTCVGMTEDVPARLAVHNAGGRAATQRFRPWEVIAYVAVRSEANALELERYFKSGSGHPFWHKRFIASARLATLCVTLGDRGVGGSRLFTSIRTSDSPVPMDSKAISSWSGEFLPKARWS